MPPGHRDAVPLQIATPFSAALLGEGHAGKFFLEAFALGGIGGFREAVAQLEESLVLSFLSLQTGLDQIHENATGAGPLGFGQGHHALGNTSGKRDALTHGTLDSSHTAIFPWDGLRRAAE